MGSPGTQSEKNQCRIYCTVDLSQNLWKVQEIRRIAKMLIQYSNRNLGTLPIIFFGNFTEQIFKNYEWKQFLTISENIFGPI